ncbi:MAG: hypothetical protein EOP50_02905 [Sphingobacteriales bacterium]|nr:MAG: hypothetical protein EOP50_02905 [Sphingobacteriales bacterium]
MANRIRFSYLNPVHLVPQDPAAIAQYNSRHFDQYRYAETLHPWQTKRPFYQPWQVADHIRIQYECDFGPIVARLVLAEDRADCVKLTQVAVSVMQNADDPTLFLYENDLILTGIPEGVYYLEVLVGDDGNGQPVAAFQSEPLKILANQKETLYLEYNHYRFHDTMIFENGFSPAIRIPGVLSLKSPSAQDTLFEDDEKSQRLIDGKPFEQYELLVGHQSGIPDWMAKKINRIFTCSNTKLDGRQYTRSGSEGMQATEEKNYPLRAWSMELRDTENKGHATYENDAFQSGPDSYIISVDRNGFGAASTGEEQILSIS